MSGSIDDVIRQQIEESVRASLRPILQEIRTTVAKALEDRHPASVETVNKKQACEILGVTKSTLDNYCANGLLEKRGSVGKPHFLKSDVERLLTAPRTAKPRAPSASRRIREICGDGE